MIMMTKPIRGKRHLSSRSPNEAPDGAVLSVAICTRNRPRQLRRALESLRSQAVPPGEILVIDNAPADDTTLRLVRGEFPMVRYLREPVPGLNFARNRALQAATGRVLAFLDDDAVADGAWSRALLTVMADPAVGACTGRVLPFALYSEAQRLFEANGGYGRGNSSVRLPRDAGRPLHGRRAPLVAWAVSVGSGCSLAVRRGTALALGGFDEALDMGAFLPGGGDHDILWRMLQADMGVVYEPAALAWHEHRSELAGAYRQLAGHQRALVALLTKIVTGPGGGYRASTLLFLAWRLLKPGVRLGRRAAGRDPLPARALLGMWWSCWSGLVAYPAARRLARRRASMALRPDRASAANG